jgi:Acetyltransferase (GNAT) domain
VAKGELMVDLEILHPERDRSRWSELLQTLRHDVYHLPDYVQLEAMRLQSEAEAMVVRQGDDLLFLPYLVRSCCDLFQAVEDRENTFDVISPYGYPGVLTQGDGDFIRGAWEHVKGGLSHRGVCAAFLRLHPILSQDFVQALPETEWVANGKTVSVDLTLTEQEIWRHTRKGHKSTINKAKRLGFQHRIISAAENFDVFWSIYKETMDRVGAQQSYYFSRDYFERLLRMEQLFLYITELEGETVAACLFFECSGIVQMHLAGTRTEYLSQSPFNDLIDHARYWAKARGNEFLHLGGGLGGSTEDSLFIFKSGFSQQRHDFYTVRCVVDPVQYQALVEHQAQAIGQTSHELIQGHFFPAYRTPAPIAA